jgi:hypothetical protein
MPFPPSSSISRAPPSTIYQFWRVSPFDVVIFFVGIVVIIFSTIENGIYTSVSITAAMLLFRIVKAKGRFLGRVKVHSVIDDQIIGSDSPNASTIKVCRGANNDTVIGRNAFLPLDHKMDPTLRLSCRRHTQVFSSTGSPRDSIIPMRTTISIT